MLHLVNKSPYERNALDSCLRMATKGSAILLLEDGIYAAVSGTEVGTRIAETAKDCQVFVLGSDLDARGIKHDRMVDGVAICDYEGFVDLVVEHGTPQSWL